MNDIVIKAEHLPESLPDLARFALVGRDKLAAVRAEISAIKKVGLAKDVLEQKKAEAQEIAELVTLSEVKIGAMLREIPKATPNNNPFHEFDTAVDFVKPKSETLKEIGIEQKTAERFQKMAEHETIVYEAIEEARRNDDIISRAAVLKKIADAEHKPHVAFNSGCNEWYTPADIIEAARRMMGGIDLDPASSEIANRVVKAAKYYTAETNGLDKEWGGNVWLNPPYSAELIECFAQKAVKETPNIRQMIILVNNATETKWFRALVGISSAICFPSSRVKFYLPDGKTGSPLQGQALLYVGANPSEFLAEFSAFGWGAALNGI